LRGLYFRLLYCRSRRRWPAVAGSRGIPSFLKLPVCLNQEDLLAGAVDVAVLGAPVDMSLGQRGASFGPMAIRTAERCLPAPATIFNHQHVRLQPFKELTVVDYGDAAVDPFSIDRSVDPIRTLVREVAETGALPIVLGGDHSILWPDAAAIAEALDGPEFLYISVDIDVLDPAYAPGTGTPEPGRLTTRELFPIIRRLCHETNVVGLEVVEVAPAGDPGYTTALNAQRIIPEAITGRAMRKRGMTGPHYLDPAAAGLSVYA
jgi:arginase family enzyme